MPAWSDCDVVQPALLWKPRGNIRSLPFYTSSLVSEIRALFVMCPSFTSPLPSRLYWRPALRYELGPQGPIMFSIFKKKCNSSLGLPLPPILLTHFLRMSTHLILEHRQRFFFSRGSLEEMRLSAVSVPFSVSPGVLTCLSLSWQVFFARN